MVNRFDELQENYNGCDYIGDFFESPLVKRAYGELWNEVRLEDIEQIKAKSFDIFKKEHLSFIREVFENQELSQRLLQILRDISLKLKDKDRFMYDNKQILSFLIVWQDIQDRVMNYSETLPEIFKEKIITIVSSIGGNTVYEDPKDEKNYISFIEGIGNLLKAGFPCIDSEGNMIFGFPTIPQVFDFYDVVNTQGEKYVINKAGEKIDEAEVESISKENIEKLKESYQKAKDYLSEGNVWNKAPDDILPILAFIVHSNLEAFKNTDTTNKLLITGLDSMILSAQDAIKKRNKEKMKATLRSV